MALAVTHILIPIVVLSLFRFYYKRWQKKITIHEILVAGIFGLLPDIDFPIDIIFSTDVHRIFTHTFIIPLALVIIGFFLLKNPQGKQKGTHWQTLAFVGAFGWVFHIILDFLTVGTITPLWPLSSMAAGLHLLESMSLETTMSYLASLDAIILLGWLWHEDAKHKIIEYF